MKTRKLYSVALLGALAGMLGVSACSGEDGKNGASGEPGQNGENGSNGDKGQDGMTGQDGMDGMDGMNGMNGMNGTNGTNGTDGEDGRDGVPAGFLPNSLSSLVAVTLRDAKGTGATNVADYVAALVDDYALGNALPVSQFPLAAAATDTVRALDGLQHNVVVKWLDPLTFDPANGVFGANADYTAYFGDGWDVTAGDAPQWNGSDSSGWMWVNHEYISGRAPTTTSAPSGQHLQLALWLAANGVLQNDVTSDMWTQADVDTYINEWKKQVGGSWLRIVQDPSSGEWTVDRGADAVRYDSTDATQLQLTGYTLSAPDHDDTGAALAAADVVVGIASDCSGAQTPWGTVISAEENVQFNFGDAEACWSSSQQFQAGAGCDAGSAMTFDVTPSTASDFGAHSDANTHHNKDVYGYLAEMDPGEAADEYHGKTTAGVGHQKIGAMGRARWENATFAVNSDWKLVPNQPIVMYGGDDRRSGRIYKYVSNQNYTSGMTRAQTRALLADGEIYAAHFAGLDHDTGLTVGGNAPTESSPGSGQWIHLSVDSTDIAPNAGVLGSGTTVGAALKDNQWNAMGSFSDDNMVRTALFTASMKVGVAELNRPEDIEWNPRDPSGTPMLYVAFTNHTRQVALDADGKLYDPAMHATASPKRADNTGAIFAMKESNAANPGASTTFEYFTVWAGSEGTEQFDAANPDNLMIDANGGVWFGTDGNFGTAGHADALYYLDRDPAHKSTPTVTYGRPFRVIAGPSDSEATGPSFSASMGTLFFSVQHPGESVYSNWPQ